MCYKGKMMAKTKFVLSVRFIWLVLLHTFTCCNAELYTALADMEELLETENVLLQTLSTYITAQENRLILLKSYAAYYAREHEKASKDPSEYLSNPVNAYLLVKRLTSDWKDTQELMQNDVYQEAMENLTRYRGDVKFPTYEDLNGAAVALLRLQDTYKLDTKSVARGELNGIQYSTQLTSGDCFELGRQSYNIEDYHHTALWMQEALRRYEVDNNRTKVGKWEILEYLAYSRYMQGDVKLALHLTEELLKDNPNHERALGNREHYIRTIEEEKRRRKGDLGDEYQTFHEYQLEEKDENKQDTEADVERARYEKLCRREIKIPVEVSSKLKCRYVNYGRPFLMLAPLKEEEAYLNPRILLFREAIYPSEIAVIKALAQPRLKRATVQNYKTGELEVANYRISKSAWLLESEDPVVERVSQRVEDMTGLTTETAEELQVVNYGIGGHYEPHFDFARREEKNAFKSLGTGNRIATVLFYMSNVAQGGATVFTALDLAVWPEEGTAAFWYNLHTSGGGDFLTRHAACPVLQGSKWVCNKWLHERGQEFRRPCDPSDEETAEI